MNLTEPQHPPYGVTQPRTLIRWLDVNSQNGQLTRTRSYFTIPTFNVNHTPIGNLIAGNYSNVNVFNNIGLDAGVTLIANTVYRYVAGNSLYLTFPVGLSYYLNLIYPGLFVTPSTNDVFIWPISPALTGQACTAQVYPVVPATDIVAAFDYVAPQSFSILGFNTKSTSGTYCVSYVNNDNSVVRYILTQDPVSPLVCDYPMYSGQIVSPNFRIEVWANTSISLAGAITVYTSLLNNVDYRYGADTKLVNSNIRTNFQTPDLTLPLVFPNPPILNT